jgi:hypothetical protein
MTFSISQKSRRNTSRCTLRPLGTPKATSAGLATRRGCDAKAERVAYRDPDLFWSTAFAEALGTARRYLRGSCD